MIAFAAGDLAHDRLAAAAHRQHVGLELGMLDRRREAVEAAPDVLRQQAEDVGHLRRVLADAQLVVEEEDADVDAVQQVVEVVGHLAELRDLALMLDVDRVELFVDRVQLLVGALQLLVRGHQLLVGRLQLLVGRLQLFDGRLQALLGEAQLRLERRHVVARRLGHVDRRLRRARQRRRPLVLVLDEKVAVADRLHRQLASSFSEARRPAVSSKRIGTPSRFTVSSIVSRVVPWVSLTITRS